MNGDIYGLPNKERTDISTWYTLGVTRWLPRIDKAPILNPKAEDFINAGCLLEVLPEIPNNKKQGDILIESNRITYNVIDKTSKELDNDAANLTKKEILEFKRSSPELLALLSDTDQNIIDDIDIETAGENNAEIVAGIRAAQVKTRLMLRDLAIIVKAILT